MKNPNSLEMGDMAITHKGGTKGYWVRGVSPDVLNFAKGDAAHRRKADQITMVR